MHTDLEDLPTNDSTNPTFAEILETRLARRTLLKGSLGFAASAFFGAGLSACAGGSVSNGNSSGKSNSNGNGDDAAPTTAKLNFDAVGKSLADALIVPAGYTARVLYRLGDPLTAATPDYRNDGTDSAASFASRAGDHHDGLHFFGIGGSGRHDPNASGRGLLVMNHEAITPSYLHRTGATIAGNVRTVPDEVSKELNVHGVSVVEVNRSGGTWSYKRDSAYNRRITTFTEMRMAGPAARSPQFVTKYSIDGTKTRGTVNNCADGYTPWGTYLTCEENWAGYFRRIAATDNPNRTPRELASFARYGVAGNGRELWATPAATDPNDTSFARWNTMKTGTSATGTDDFRNVVNTYGWVVEIDPFNPSSTPAKRTALGRFAHENAALGPVTAGRPLVYYMGCDSRMEYVYKFVSAASWDPADATRGMAAGDKYLDAGRLYAAVFNADGTGIWKELKFGDNGITPGNGAFAFADQTDVLIHTRLAADAAGATKMDRPEWAAVHPRTGEVYMTLTNNNGTNRTLASTNAANPRFYNDPKGAAATAQRGNPNGHIIRWAETNADPAATTFRWDVFLFGARSGADRANVNVSGLTAANDFSSPDGAWFSRATSVLWLQTDDGAYTDATNCMMLAAVPGPVGDGGRKTIVNSDGAGSKSVETPVGAPLGETNLRRFLVGPKECEITGVAETPDGKALFVNIQHPGEDSAPNFTNPASFGSHWPDGGNARPRSATIVITKNDGGPIGGDPV